MKKFQQGFNYSILLSLALAVFANLALAVPAQSPLFLSNAVAPKILLNMSKDHQLFFKAYDDFSDLDDDGTPDTTYKHSIDYYGYFDSHKCYTYDTANLLFIPSDSVSSDKYCSGQWSGNFLNWATTSRIDAVRKILYGGLRSTDTATRTILERAYLPHDAHSWAKFYKGSDLDDLTPFNESSGITICNTSEPQASGVLSQSTTAKPLIRVAKGDYSLWAANERWQCLWNGEIPSSGGGTNGNVTATTGLNASASSPDKSSQGLGAKDYIARVEVCIKSASYTLTTDENQHCKVYSNNLKPKGLLQEYGDDEKMKFGLITGSYQANKDGGVLRKNISSFADEIDSNGVFLNPTAGIIKTINKFRLVGYKYGSGLGWYNDSIASGGDNCGFNVSSFSNGNCRNWGNPQAEMLLEALRYITNNSATAAFAATDSVLGLPAPASFIDPIPDTDYCAGLNVIQFNASAVSYDADNLGGVSSIMGTSTALNNATDGVGAGEIPAASQYFIGENGSSTAPDNNQLCTAKTISPTVGATNALSKVRGTCPDAPRLSGSYQLAGLAHYAHTHDLRSDRTGNQTVKMYGITLAPSLPKVVVPVPGSTTKKITIMPACRNTTNDPDANCAIVDFKIITQSPVGSNPMTGTLYVNWEDNEQGADFDQDQWGLIKYKITSSNVEITTDVIAQSTPFLLGFGYVISGTTKDGFHVHSGINGFKFTDTNAGSGTVKDCSASAGCNSGDTATTVTYNVGTSNASSLQDPLFYAAKWGGFKDSNANLKPDLTSEWDQSDNGSGVATPDGVPDNYFSVNDPARLETSLAAALEDIALGDAAASAVATNSTQLNTGSLVYQATFNPIRWSGDVEAFAVDPITGALTSNWKASDIGRFPAPASRNIVTYNPLGTFGNRGILFEWNQLTCPAASGTCSAAKVISGGKSQQDYLNKLPPSTTSDGKGTNRLNWLRGDRSQEKLSPTDTVASHIFRKRLNVLGDIVNSDPLFVGTQDYGYSALAGVEGTSYTAFRGLTSYANRRTMLYVGANDGMLHGFDARKNISPSDSGGNEVLAYVPNAIFPELSKLTSLTYTHQYYVDGDFATGDVYDPAVPAKWRTLVIGSLGRGGRAIFGLDVTNPDSFGASSPLWEFSNSNDVDLGYTLPQPIIARLEDGHWVVLVANGYDSDNGKAVLFVLDAVTGAVLQKINTNVGPATPPGRPDKNGLSSPIAVDTNNNRSIDTVYAGDLYGNLWKFNLSGTAGSYPTPTSPIFVACSTVGAGSSCPTTNRQPITAKINVGNAGGLGTDQNNVGIMVYFGTGKFFDPGDNLLPATPQVQSFYGLWDRGSIITDRALLQKQTIEFEGQLPTNCGLPSCPLSETPVRLVSKEPVCYDAASLGCTAASPLKQGWVMDLLVNSGTPDGERVVSFPFVRRGLVIFPTIIPNPIPCEKGGKAWLMELGALTGGEAQFPPFDTNGNTKVDSTDLVKADDGTYRHATGTNLDIGIMDQPAIIESDSVDFKYLSGQTTQMGKVVDCGDDCGGGGGGGGTGTRRSWRQLNIN